MAQPKKAKARPATNRPASVVTDWLALVDHDGAFLTPGVLLATFPAGFDRMSKEQRAELRSRVADLGDDPADRISLRRWLLGELLEWGDELVDGQQIPPVASATAAEHAVDLQPDAALVDVDDPNRVRLGVFIWPYGTDLDARAAKVLTGDDWRASPRERAERWCREAGTPLALVTDGEQFLLLWAPRGAAAASGAFRLAELADERVLQDGLVSLLSARRFFAVDDAPKTGETLEQLFERSADTEVEVTKGLGRQVRRSVELLVSALSREHVASGHKLLGSVSYSEVYEASVTVMMRLVFLLFAEERRLLPAEDPLWADSYSVLDLRGELRAASLRDGEDALEKRAMAWTRLLATFRAVHGGVNHDRLSLPAYGGALFDPERFPFLEGRHESGSGTPPAVDDRTILAILDALLTVQVSQGRGTITQQVSYKALDVEQIGHCYEGLLDHGCDRVDKLSVGLVGAPSAEPELTVDELDAHRADGDDAMCEWLADKERCAKSASALKKLLAKVPEPLELARLRAACDNDGEAVSRILPYWGLLREDLRGLPVVFPPDGLYVTQTSTRRNMGAQYTTKALAEEVVQYALEPLTYDPGPQNEVDPEKWKIRTPTQILDLKVCDPAVGSGAILTAAGRYLADRLLDAIDEHGPGEGPQGERLAELVSASPDDRVTYARREVVDHCLYGVDKNPVAAEMAKLSLWLTTMARDRPFTFLDHAIQSGDSLLGITDIEQLRWLHLDPSARKGAGTFATLAIDSRINEAVALAQELQSISVVTARDADHKRQLHERLKAMLDDLSVVADVVVGASLRSSAKGSRISYEDCIAEVSDRVRVALDDDYSDHERAAALEILQDTSERWLRTELPDAAAPTWERRCLHWPLAFPEVLLRTTGPGFDGAVANPPFLGDSKITSAVGVGYREHLVEVVAGRRGRADLVAFFLVRMSRILHYEGMMGSLATNTVGQGDTREVGLDQLLQNQMVVFRARKTEAWPGEANLQIAKVWLAMEWHSVAECDGRLVAQIGPMLDPVSRVSGEPHRLLAGGKASFKGSDLGGAGFILDPAEAEDLLRDRRNEEVIWPFLNGEDLNSHPGQLASRFTIDFRDWPLEKASSYSRPFQIVVERVKPYRDTVNRDSHRRWWWHYGDKRPELYRRISGLSRVIVIAQTSNLVQPAFVHTKQVLSTALVVFTYDDDAHFGLLSSSFHRWWALKYSSTMRTDVRYTGSDVFETFPQPMPQLTSLWEQVGHAGRTLDEFRSPLMTRTHLGLTKTYNRLHNPDEQDPDIVRLRELHVELDYAVRDAYGWSDLALDHHHWETPQGMRFTVSPAAKDELLDRLLELNHERYAEEVAAGLHDTKKGKAKAKPKKAAENQGALEL